MHEEEQRSDISQLEELEAQIARLSRRRLELIRRIDLSGEWDYGEFGTIEHWVSCHLQISWIDAKRRVEASHAIESLPLISQALESGSLSLDKAVQLTRYATPESETELVEWARTVSVKTVREAADAAQRLDVEDVRNNDRLRNFGWRPIEGGAALSFFGALPAEQGAVVTTALDRIAARLTELPHEEICGGWAPERAETLPQRRADALVYLASQTLSGSQDADRATVIVHAPLAALAGETPAELAGGALLHPEVARRLSCDSRIQTVLEDGTGEPIGIGRVSQSVPPWLKRLVKARDRCCTFPGCEDMRYTEAHHIWHWALGGPTDLDNLVLVCGFHHKAVHEYGWGVDKRSDGTIEWFRPSGRVHGVRLPRPRGPDEDPPLRGIDEQPELLAVP